MSSQNTTTYTNNAAPDEANTRAAFQAAMVACYQARAAYDRGSIGLQAYYEAYFVLRAACDALRAQHPAVVAALRQQQETRTDHMRSSTQASDKTDNASPLDAAVAARNQAVAAYNRGGISYEAYVEAERECLATCREYRARLKARLDEE